MKRFRNMIRGWLTGPDPSTSYAGIRSAAEMRLILQRERLRCDRFNSGFALGKLTFAAKLRGPELTVLSAMFQQRLRATDDAGMLGRKQLGLLLPETSSEGAWKVVDDLCDLLPASLGRPQCQVFVYPSTNEEPAGELVGQASEARESQPMQVMFVRPLPAWKRGMDIAVSSLALLLLSPLLILTAVAIKLTSRGPVFFAQQREGVGGRTFSMYKFRSMVVDAESIKDKLRAISEQDGPAFKLKNDPRVTAIGRFLRRTCIDELPQFFNVLKGDLSLVGPRPLPCDESRRCEMWQRRRLDVTPGLTCIWQVRGGTKVTFNDWMRMDLRYSRCRSLWNDFRLVLQTIPAIIQRDGVY